MGHFQPSLLPSSPEFCRAVKAERCSLCEALCALPASGRRGSPSEPHLCVWSHAAVPNSISSLPSPSVDSRAWRQARNLLPGPLQDWYPRPFLTLNFPEALCGGGCAPYALWHLHVLSATTQLRERSPWGWRSRWAGLRDPALPLPPGPSLPAVCLGGDCPWSPPAATAQLHSRLRACVSAPEPLQAP